MAAKCEQARLVALDERLECAMVPAPDESDQLLVALEPQERRTPYKRRQPRRVLECGCFHEEKAAVMGPGPVTP
jgi:hypothetical protein